MIEYSLSITTWEEGSAGPWGGGGNLLLGTEVENARWFISMKLRATRIFTWPEWLGIGILIKFCIPSRGAGTTSWEWPLTHWYRIPWSSVNPGFLCWGGGGVAGRPRLLQNAKKSLRTSIRPSRLSAGEALPRLPQLETLWAAWLWNGSTLVWSNGLRRGNPCLPIPHKLTWATLVPDRWRFVPPMSIEIVFVWNSLES